MMKADAKRELLRGRGARLFALVLLIGLSVAPRLPLLHNSTAWFNSDEAVDALVLKHAVEQGELTLHNWDASYYGVAEGLIGLPVVYVLGFSALSFKVSAFLGFIALLLAIYALARRLYDTRTALLAVALLAVFSPQLVLWSTLAAGGYALMIAWGTMAILARERLLHSPRPLVWWRLVLFGALLGVGLYIYELFLIYVATFFACAVLGSSLWRLLFERQAVATREVVRDGLRELRALALVGGGLLVGWTPKIALWVGGDVGTKRPFYALAGMHQGLANLKLLIWRCAPSLLGANPSGAADVVPWTGPPTPTMRVLGTLVVLVYVVAWMAAARSVWRERSRSGELGARRYEIGGRALLVLLVPITAALFVVSPNPQNVLSSRYLLPWLSSLPILAAAFLIRCARRGPALGAALAALLLLVPAVAIDRVALQSGDLASPLALHTRSEPLFEVLEYLRGRRIEGAYAPYWTAYKATFLSRETLIVTPFLDWDRYPEYTRRVNAGRNVAYVFPDPPGDIERAFLARLKRAAAPFETASVGPYRIYSSPTGDRLLPATTFFAARPLTDPRARVEVLDAPARVAPGEAFEIPVRVQNTGGEGWSAQGNGSGTYRVAVAYRWFDARGGAVNLEGERTLLPEDLAAGKTAELRAHVLAPQTGGALRLRVTLVQEGVRWFDDLPGASATREITVAATP